MYARTSNSPVGLLALLYIQMIYAMVSIWCEDGVIMREDE